MIQKEKNRLIRRNDQELLCIEAWGKNSFRIRATNRFEFIPDDVSSLLAQPECEVDIKEENGCVIIQNGKLKCVMGPTGKMGASRYA